jgi:hypothetical protein
VLDLSVKCSKEHKMTKPQAGGDTVARLTEQHFLWRIPPEEMKSELLCCAKQTWERMKNSVSGTTVKCSCVWTSVLISYQEECLR